MGFASSAAKKVRILKDGIKPKFKSSVEAISFSAQRALMRGQKVIYVTERCAFRLTAQGLELSEVYDGIDINKDILGKLDFQPRLGKGVQKKLQGLN